MRGQIITGLLPGARNRWLYLVVVVLAGSCSTRALADDNERGRLLYENHCTECHTSQAHVREGRKIKTPAQLNAWVKRWESTLGLDWSASSTEAVARYLAFRYYRFAARSKP